MAKTIKRLINVTSLIEAINDELYMDESTKAAFRSIVYQQPLIDDAPVVHGRWEKHEPDKCGNRKPKCSVCGEYHLAWWSEYTRCNYCPNCGARMDGGVSDG